MTTWLEEYISALDAREASQQATNDIVDAYTRLADRAAALQKAAEASPSPPDRAESPTPSAGRGKGRSITPSSTIKPDSPAQSTELAQLRTDLSAAQKSKASLEGQLSAVMAEMSALKISSTADGKAAALISRQKLSLERKLKDRESELREKSRLVESVQDDMVGLQLELNIAEEKAQKVERENRDLVERWMQRVGKEAEDMNEEYSWK